MSDRESENVGQPGPDGGDAASASFDAEPLPSLLTGGGSGLPVLEEGSGSMDGPRYD
ncbi:hypothetical protein HDU96_008922 [Phlyctochytrium bullatum]|nr:hypothetical protein HDU96_008922 [Phlyctochytrium bullatum]